MKQMTRTNLSRRELLKRAGMAGAAVAMPADAFIPLASLSRSWPLAQTGSARREPLETLTSAEAITLEAIVARLIPTDANGPGATEASAAHYIDRALGGALAPSREAYRSGLLAIDAHARSSKGSSFAQLSAADQDAVLRDIENDAFFNLVRAHTIQGTFCDPFYGGNANFVGWDLIGYPGVRLAVASGDQQLTSKPAPNHRSAYDHAMFSKKKPARASRRTRQSDGD